MGLTKKERFSALFDKHYNRLFNYSFKVLKDKSISEEIVQETFIKLWENIESISEKDRSIEAYLIVTLKNKIIDNHRKNKVRQKHANLFSLNIDFQNDIDNEWEIYELIQLVFTSLPSKTVEIFKLSRDNGFSYKEIAAKKNISIKTVEAHISKSLIAFRKELKKYL